MIVPRLKGGVGNQLFQLAAAIGKAAELNTDYAINYAMPHVGQQGYAPIRYKETLYKDIPSTSTLPSFTYNELKFSYDRIPDYVDMLIDGYFQSDKYFQNCKSVIKDLFYIPNIIKDKVDSKLQTFSKKILGIHVRIGDFLSPGNITSHYVCTREYYANALKNYNLNDYIIIVCTDDKNNLSSVLPIDNFILSNSKNELEDLYILSQCDNLILTNSSFSWWGAYLGKEKERVMVPTPWFAKDGPKDINDVYCDKWIKVPTTL
jgi:hypothetical protein